MELSHLVNEMAVVCGHQQPCQLAGAHNQGLSRRGKSKLVRCTWKIEPHEPLLP